MPHVRPASPPSSPFPSPFCPVSQTLSLWCIYWSDTVPVPVLCSNVWWVFKHRRCFRYCWAVCCFVLKFIFLVISIPPVGLELRTPRFTLTCASSQDSRVPHDLLFYSTTFTGNQSVFSYLSFWQMPGGPSHMGRVASRGPLPPRRICPEQRPWEGRGLSTILALCVREPSTGEFRRFVRGRTAG